MLCCAHTSKMRENVLDFYFFDIFENGFSSFSGHIGHPRDKYSREGKSADSSYYH